ncbi:ATP12 family chaperone protein [Halodurantibacterium flavum]|uniref:ATP12 family chaperone protein n=1 Tax=Halodurantibacterium flavum TaxID=1382802 RepID=A0ABW4S1W8_9RHOB
MSGWKRKRFWTAAQVMPSDAGFRILLDERPLRTPAKSLLEVPSERLALVIAAEWDAQDGEIRPETMPFTRLANSAIDKVVPQFEAVADLLAAYGATDLICYRAEGPEELVARQEAGWGPLLEWVAGAGAPLAQTAGIVHVAQPEASLTRLRDRVMALSPFELAAFHDLVAISGSLVIALAVLDRREEPEAAWHLSRIDEDWQAELWGADEEATEVANARRQAFLDAALFLRFLRDF